jgi:hypothetical protein
MAEMRVSACRPYRARLLKACKYQGKQAAEGIVER